MDSRELIAELRGKKWMVNCEMRGLIPDDTAERAAAHIAALDARIEAAAQTIATLRKENAKAVEGLEFYAKWHEQPSDGPWGADSRDFGDVARKTIKELRP